MIINRNPARPLSRMDNNTERVIIPVGIPERLISFSKVFPNVDIDEEDKENATIMAPKKQEKTQVKTQKIENDHVFRRRTHSAIVNVMSKLENKVKQNKVQPQQPTLSGHLQLPLNCEKPFSQNLRTEQKKPTEKVSLGSEEKSFARRVRERIEAESAKNEQKKKKRSIGEDAYLPFPLKELRQKIVQRSRKVSEDYSKVLIF